MPDEPEERTQDEIERQASDTEPDETTAREGLEEALMQEGASDEGRDLGEEVR